MPKAVNRQDYTAFTSFTVLFAIARTVGWVAQWTEMIGDPDSKLMRPRQLFTGSALRHYVPVERRG